MALAYGLALTALLCWPGNRLPQPTGNWFERLYMDKWIHVGLFGVLVYFFCKAFGNKGYRSWMCIAILGCLYGILMEFVQKWLIPNRGFELLDIVADCAGAGLGYVLYSYTVRRRQSIV
jgi:VanZ family protein